jgi:hypothetical protein
MLHFVHNTAVSGACDKESYRMAVTSSRKQVNIRVDPGLYHAVGPAVNQFTVIVDTVDSNLYFGVHLGPNAPMSTVYVPARLGVQA